MKCTDGPPRAVSVDPADFKHKSQMDVLYPHLTGKFRYARDKIIQGFYDDGMHVIDIAAAVGLSQSGVDGRIKFMHLGERRKGLVVGQREGWSQARIDQLYHLRVICGHSFDKCANIMSLTKNQCIGKFNRIWGTYSKRREQPKEETASSASVAGSIVEEFLEQEGERPKIMLPYIAKTKALEYKGVSEKLRYSNQCMDCNNTAQPGRVLCGGCITKAYEARNN